MFSYFYIGSFFWYTRMYNISENIHFKTDSMYQYLYVRKQSNAISYIVFYFVSA